MTVRVIVTRAEPGADETVNRVQGLGFSAVKCSALRLVALPGDEIETPNADEAYIFTSANGVRAAIEQNWPNTLPAICVGPATMTAAQNAGFASRYNANGNSEDVYRLVLELYSNETAPNFVHVANEAAAGDLANRLRTAGYRVRFAPLYKTEPVPYAELGRIDFNNAIILVHSAKGAASVRDWIVHGKIDSNCLGLVAVSQKAAAPLADLSFAHISIADHPNEDELMKALQSHHEQGV